MISIIIPAYNQARKLDRCLKSIREQTIDNYEIILVNDGSTDQTEKVAKKYKQEFGLTMTYVSQENQGSNSARNRGFKLSKGEYVIFCDADIYMRADMLEVMRTTLKNNPDAGYAYSSFTFGSKTFMLWEFDAEKLRQMPYIHSTSLIKQNVLPDIPWDENIPRLQDWDLWLTLLEKNVKGVWIDRILFHIETGGTMSHWLPSFAYKLFPFLPKVRKYKQAEEIIKKKHGM